MSLRPLALLAAVLLLTVSGVPAASAQAAPPASPSASPSAATAGGGGSVLPVMKAAPTGTESQADSQRSRSSAAATPALRAGSSDVVRNAVLLTLLAVLPALVVCMTPFIRIVVVLAMVRHAFGMPETPPNAVLISLALLVSVLVMGDTLGTVKREALDPYLAGTVSVDTALSTGSGPMRAFMLRQVSDSDLAAVYGIARRPLPEAREALGLMEVTAAFMLSELRTAFKIGFVIFLPFLVIDIVVSSLLIALGMLMVPPSTISLPIKVLMFVLIDGWSLILGNVAASFR
jgi:flagellar biosynthetic protein FliP